MNPTALAFALLAAAGATLPAAAETLMLPGTLCTSDGPLERSITGLSVNKVTTSGTTGMNCPFIRTQPATSVPTSVTVHVNARTNGLTGFHCQARSVSSTNVTFDLQDVVIAAGSANGSYASSAFTLLLPPTLPDSTPASINMRCQVPNMSGTIAAGIVSYGISD